MRIISIILLLAAFLPARAQDPGRLNALNSKVFPAYKMYFEKITLEASGIINLSALDQYKSLTVQRKQSILSEIAAGRNDSLVIVTYGSQRELWGRNFENGAIELYDSWNIEKIKVTQAPVIVDSKPHPWFFYVGGLIQGDSNKNLNLAFNSRVGFFLLANKWDLATTLTAGASGNLEATATLYSNIGLMSRVHFPIKGTGFSPNIGAEISTSITEGFNSYSGAAVVGISWFIGIGSVDIGVNIGNEISSLAGFTFYPGMKSRSRK